MTAHDSTVIKFLDRVSIAPLLCLMISATGMGCVVGLMKFRYNYQTANAFPQGKTEPDAVHPTVLPFRKDQTRCEENGGAWTNNECVDHAHNPTF